MFQQPDLPETVDELLTYLELDKYKIIFRVEEVLTCYLWAVVTWFILALSLNFCIFLIFGRGEEGGDLQE
jgi:hypothetical protein